jgi:hypothetical protein
LRTALLLVFFGAFVLGMGLARPKTVETAPEGVLAPSAPKQRRAASRRPWAVEEYQLTSLAEYEVEARRSLGPAGSRTCPSVLLGVLP